MYTSRAEQIVQTMLQGDLFSQWLGIKCLQVEAGRVVVEMMVRPEMVNGFGIAHGGISYSLADTALAFASNGHGPQCLSIDTSINHLAKIYPGDRLIAEAIEESKDARLAVYLVRIHNQDLVLVASFKGMVYRTKREWPENETI
ncbi:MAG: hotdog fold thioesterase [Saprospiraceae bacterium]